MTLAIVHFVHKASCHANGATEPRTGLFAHVHFNSVEGSETYGNSKGTTPQWVAAVFICF